jgi:hypothetical protein
MGIAINLRKGLEMRAKHLIVPAILFVLSLVPARMAAADTGPKPTMDFEFLQNASGAQLTILSGILYECQQSDCSDAKPLTRGGPQGFSCDQTSCHALAYGFSPYHRIEIQFSDGTTRRSNIFQTAGFNSRYQVTIGEADLLVQAQPGSARVTALLVTVLCCCLVVFLLVLIGFLVWLLMRRRPGRASVTAPADGQEHSDGPGESPERDTDASAEHSD